MKIIATYAGMSEEGHHLLKDVSGDMERDHAWLNCRAGFPDGVEIGQRVSFFASLFYRPGGARLTDVREVRRV